MLLRQLPVLLGQSKGRNMDRRSFIFALIGGTAAASVINVTSSHAASVVRKEVTDFAPSELAAAGLDDVEVEYSRHMTWAGHGRMRRRRGSMMRSGRPMKRKSYKRTRRARPMQQGS